MTEGTYVEGVLQKAEALKRVGFWQPEPHVRPRAWLDNFEPAEQIAAAAILDSLLYYSDTMMYALLRATYQSLADLLYTSSINLNDAIFTRIEDETPNPSDSGNIFCRKARYQLDIPEERLVEPADALQMVIVLWSSSTTSWVPRINWSARGLDSIKVGQSEVSKRHSKRGRSALTIFHSLPPVEA